MSSYFLVSSWISSLSLSRSSSVSVLVLLAWSAALLPSRRTLRIATLASSVSSLMRPTSFRRTSVESGGMFRRITRPSFCGLRPRPLALDGLFDVLDRAGIERADDDLRRLRGADRGQLLDRRRRAVDLDAQRIDQARVGPAGANAGQGVLEHVDGLFHALFDVEQDFVGAHGQLPLTCHRKRFVTGLLTRQLLDQRARLLMIVPTFSPFTARSMLPSLRKLNTRIGMSCSMHCAMAVGSITRRFCSRTAL